MKPNELEKLKKQKYWYKIYITECPVCGTGTTEKERMYSDKPKNADERYKFTEYYDWCNE